MINITEEVDKNKEEKYNSYIPEKVEEIINKKMLVKHPDNTYNIEYPGSGWVSNFNNCKKKILKCRVASEFVVNEQYGSYDEYSIGAPGSHPHTHNNTFLMLQIVEVYENPEPLKGFQRTWVKLE